MSIKLNIAAFTFELASKLDAVPLKITAKRYTAPGALNEQGLTLIFTHNVGSHKEQWEPTIEQLFVSQNQEGGINKIREVWSFDWQSHGDAGILNKEAFKKRAPGVSIYEWAEAIAAFVDSPEMKGRRIVMLGHSAGAGTIILTTKYLPTPPPYTSIILVEPTIVAKEIFDLQLEERMSTMDFVTQATAGRRDKWDSREVAEKWLAKRYPWNTWDERVFKTFVEHGLADTPEGGVTLKCDKLQEAASYAPEGHWEAATILGPVSDQVPVHLIWGTANDVVPDFIQDSLADVKEGRHIASVVKVDDVGHAIVQENPDALAAAISRILSLIGQRMVSKL